MKQLRWIFGLTGLAALSLLGLQAYIWTQGIQQERDRFSRALHHAVFEATEEFMSPLESVVVSDITQNAIELRRPGFIALQIGEVDTSLVRTGSQKDLEDSFEARVTIIEQKDLILEDISDVEHVRIGRHRFEPGDIADLDSLKNWTAQILSDSLNSSFFIRQKEQCPSCATGFSQLSTANFKPYLEKELERLGIDAEFEWGVSHFENWIIVDGDSSRLATTDWQFPFFAFPGEPLDQNAEPVSVSSAPIVAATISAPVISLYFPREHLHLLRSMGPTLLVSSTLVLFVLGFIGYALYVILRQKQLSEVKTDFINNMTHELKTPISTIALACEAMQDPELELPTESRRHYLSMIANENERLGSQVEKVLQMALLDKKDLDLKIEPVDIHHLLRETVEAFSLQVDHRNGSIKTTLAASKNIVKGDLMHLRQMFSNLLDNANKYSPEAPDILVETQTKDGGIEIAIHDKGLGISREALRKIFDRFYRVSTGNRHDVKGFGLGLSYVQTMALAHGGSVYARSKPGAGSSFYLYLPYSDA